MDHSPQGNSKIEIGDSIGGCRVVKLIGCGGMGAVYEAHQVSLDRRVAVKVLRAARNNEQVEAQSRLIQEARLAARLNHPNIVQIFDVGEERGVHFMLMEFVEGVTLGDLLVKQPLFPVDRLVRVATKVARGLSVAHREHVVHRDIKPANILLTSSGEVKIADFGSAGLAFGENMPGKLVCITPSFAPPEVLRGHSFDGRADMYSLGILLHQAAAGSHPFGCKDQQEMLKAHLTREPPDLLLLRPGMAPEFARVIGKLCSKNPHERLDSDQFLKALEQHPDWERESASGLAMAQENSDRTPAVENQRAAKPGERSILNSSLMKDARRTQPSERPRPSPSPKSKVERGPRSYLLHGGETPPGSADEKTTPVELVPKKGDDARAGEICIQARFHLMKNELEKAEACFYEALELDPENEVAILGLARTLVEESQPREAIHFLRQAVSGGNVNPGKILESHHFQSLREFKEFRALMAEYSV